MKLKKILKAKWLYFILGSALIFEIVHLESKLSKVHRSTYRNRKRYKKIFTSYYRNIPAKRPTLPKELTRVPFADQNGIVLNVKKLHIRNIEAPYNASILEKDDGYLLFFRYDKFDQEKTWDFSSNIGITSLDKNFEQRQNEFVKVNTGSIHSEDPRSLQIGNKFYLFYNDLLPHEKRRTMRVAEVNPETGDTSYITNLDLHINPIEKNWVPFVHGETSEIHFDYQLNPRAQLKLPNPQKAEILHLSSNTPSHELDLEWPKKWGEPHGGTPARLVDGQYLAFFQSRFKDRDKMIWYVMAAYTFEAKAPFKITGVSKYPILFKGMYDTHPQNTANPLLRCIYPAGYAIEEKDGKTLFHLSCGENDSAVKVLTIDKDALMQSLVSKRCAKYKK